MSAKELLHRYPHITPLQVQWNDMDAFQHVNNTVYFRYLESARIAFLHTLTSDDLKIGTDATSHGLALAETRCRFKVSLTFPDQIYVGSAVREIADSHFIVQHEIVSEKMALIAAEGDARMVYLDYEAGGRRTIEGELKKRIEAVRLKP